MGTCALQKSPLSCSLGCMAPPAASFGCCQQAVLPVVCCTLHVFLVQDPPAPGAAAGGRQELLSAARSMLDRKAAAAGKRGTHFPLLLNSSGVMVRDSGRHRERDTQPFCDRLCLSIWEVCCLPCAAACGTCCSMCTGLYNDQRMVRMPVCKGQASAYVTA